MKFLIDMNLSPQWIKVFLNFGLDAVHWSDIGKYDASDNEILQWAKNNDYIVFTHDLDFGAILAATKTRSPSVIQIRTQDISPDTIGKKVIDSILDFEPHLSKGALISIDEYRSRARILPILK